MGDFFIDIVVFCIGYLYLAPLTTTLIYLISFQYKC